MTRARIIVSAIAFALLMSLGAACQIAEIDSSDGDSALVKATGPDRDVDGDSDSDSTSDSGSGSGSGSGSTSNSDDDYCLGEDDGSFTYEVGYSVIGGELADVCFGTQNDTLAAAWTTLAELVPAGQLRDLTSFTGFTQDPDSDDVTLAFVAAVDDTGSAFEMAVNLNETGDRDEFNLTLVHEFSHVFTSIPTELDRGVGENKCPTYWNGEGCYTDGSIMADWVSTFWADKVDRFDPTADELSNGAEQRCDLDSGFLGSYAATSPEEDFAESFAAYVMRIPDKTGGQAARLDWIDAQPGLREFRSRAVEQGYGPQPHNFDACG